ncbi:DUF6290 family protein [Rhodococcus pyridinivorans]|uniref:DUF6290 family protein n=1 Tax=Rhodococcus pyridinivorans TaxID=103816 RepID=UPI003AAA8AE3
MASKTTEETGAFTVRIGPDDYKVLASLARLKRTTVAELARDYIRAQMEQQVDEEAIERAVEEEKQRILQAVAALKKKR